MENKGNSIAGSGCMMWEPCLELLRMIPELHQKGKKKKKKERKNSRSFTKVTKWNNWQSHFSPRCPQSVNRNESLELLWYLPFHNRWLDNMSALFFKSKLWAQHGALTHNPKSRVACSPRWASQAPRHVSAFKLTYLWFDPKS